MESDGQEPQEQESDSKAPAVTYGGAALLLQYSRLRSSGIVARALAEHFPTEEAWVAAMNDPALHEALSSFSQMLEELQQETRTNPSTADLMRLGQQHYGRALECIEAFALQIGVTPADLLLVSM